MCPMLHIILPTICTIAVLESMAKPLPMALPPTVRPATKADIPKEMIWGMEKSKFARICVTMAAEALPDTTPQISPITSQQMLLTLSALRKRLIASWAPITFRAAIEWKGFSSAEVTATPIISKTIPISTMNSKITNATAIVLTAISWEEQNEMSAEIAMVRKKMVIIHFTFVCFPFFLLSESDFDTIIPLSFLIDDGSRQDKSYGLGRVVFHQAEPAVAAQAVSV